MKKTIQNQSYDRELDVTSVSNKQRYYRDINLSMRWRNSPSILEIKLTLQQEFHGNRVLIQLSVLEAHQIPLCIYTYTGDYTINRQIKIGNQCFVSI